MTGADFVKAIMYLDGRSTKNDLLVYADWLEEQCRMDDAAWVRVADEWGCYYSSNSHDSIQQRYELHLWLKTNNFHWVKTIVEHMADQLELVTSEGGQVSFFQ